ncbi:MAG TPA: PBP1A family penicillin-binding protein [Chthoniobacteraceae bacterium]
MPKKSRPKQNTARFPRLKRWLLFGAIGCFLVVAVLCLVYGFWASTFDMEGVKQMRERSTVYDMDGKVYSRLQGENRIVVPLAQVSRNFQEALLIREDARFFSHHGVDPIGIVRAIVRNFTSGATQQGASTLTQQLARNSFPLGGKTIHRKLLEAFVSARIEQHYTKEEILEHYVNRIYFGAGVYGVETASLAYFNKHAADLTVGEAAMVAGIIRAPTSFSPFTNMKGALHQRNQVLERMVKSDKLTRVQADAAKETPITLAKRRPIAAQENYAMDAVRRDLDQLLSEDQRDDGGLKIYTTIDPTLQRAAQTAVDAQLRKIEAKPGFPHPKKADFSDEAQAQELQTPYLQGSLVAVDNRTGGIRALVGGRDYAESKLNRALMSQRQIGSTFKPFVYAAAFERGLLPGAAIDDARIERGEVRQAANWSPENSDGTYKGLLRAEEGLIQSRNTMSVRVGERAGIESIAKVAGDAGIAGMPQQPSVYLGAFEATLAQITAAYTVFPNNGMRRQSYIIERIDDSAGEPIYRAAHISRPAMSPAVSWVTSSALMKVFERGTASTAKSLGFSKPAAGKTGTTNDYHDAWFVGYTSGLTCGVWVGLDKPATIMPKGYGSALALPIWVDAMKAASPQRYPAGNFKPPEPLRRTTVCNVSSRLATSGCDRAGTAYAAELPASLTPRDSCDSHRGGVLVDAPPQERTRRSGPPGIFRSFRRFFGGE